ncbi:tetratricopeptide repeat protein [Sandaracinus amylolyticus]|uniref:tetratricopeptide repeat protein n=1 Tax=Sandaracinus amylolyticus TaxID=927083 RepID=UPI001F3CB7E9|nr:tetratricopeptide repeat protein [Sandaracinus amylolyticus]UJR81395.1 Thiol-disulfide isomerase [Sandaracinus amylolyticus]
MNRRSLAVLAVVLLSGAPVVLASTTAEAQASSSAVRVDSEARSLFEAGAAAFADGRYEDALGHFRRSYELSGRPELLYNIGQAHDRLRHDAEAVAAFEEYIAAVPDAAQREEIAARLAILRASMERADVSEAGAEATPEVEPATVETAEPAEPEIVAAPAPDPAPWVLLGTGGAVAITGAILLGFGYADVATVENARDVPFSSVRRAYDDAPVLTGIGWAALGVGVAVAGVGLVWGLSSGGGSSGEHARLQLGPTGIAASGSF